MANGGVKILITSHRFHPDIGGIETVTEILARHFSAAGHAVRLITQSPAGAADPRSFPFAVLRRPSPWQLLSCYRWADVVLQSNLELHTLWPQWLCRRPLVIALHTWIRSAAGERGLLQRFKQFSLRSADALIACSQALRLDCHPRAAVIGNPYNSALFRPIPAEPRRQAIAFLGRLVSDKGADALLRAFAALRPVDWRLSLIGAGPERPRLQQLAAELGVHQLVDVVGPLQGEALARMLNQHEIMVVPSRWREPFGVVVLEGLACGCVVLASDGGGLPDAVGPAGLLFRRGDQADLEARLKLLIEDADLRERLRARAPDHLARFEQHNVCSTYLETLEQVHQQRQRRQA